MTSREAERPAPVHAFWCRIPSRPNFGDALTPWLIRRLTGRHPVFVRPEDARLKYFVVGSILSYVGARCVVWGSGIITRHDLVSPAATLLAVRGPLTRARARACGAECPEVYGDPALLLPRLYRPRAAERRGVGVLPHYADKPRLEGRLPPSPDLRWIDVQDPIESVIDQICACEVVASSSLHGLIVSHAYGVPALWVKFGAHGATEDTKFHDHYLSVGQEPPEAYVVDGAGLDAAAIARRAPAPPALPDLDPLWRACPFGGAA